MKILKPKQFGKVAVLCGGWSSEREVSLRSGRCVFDALQKQGVGVQLLDVGENIIQQLQGLEVDCVFNILHGGQGENGVVAALLDLMHLPYPGSGVKASALAMDKWRSKLVLQRLGLPVLPGVLLAKGDDLFAKIAELSFPLCFKPFDGGSSIGVSRVTCVEEVQAAFDKAAAESSGVLVEPWTEGREFFVSIVQDEVLPILEVVSPGGFYSYEYKYVSKDTQYLCPAEMPGALEQSIKETALSAFKALGCADWGRVDLIQGADGDAYVSEINTLPGMTERSDVPLSAAAAGMSYEEVVLAILSTILDPICNGAIR